MSEERILRLQTFLAKSPGDPFLNHALALEYVKMEADDKALASFEKNLEGAPDYVATYYHLGKLLERLGNTQRAMHIYEQGMAVAKAAGDNHTYNELQAAHEDLAY